MEWGSLPGSLFWDKPKFMVWKDCFLGVGVVMCHFCVAWGSHSPQSNMAGWQIHETKNSIVPRRTPHCCQPGHIIRQNQTISEAVPTCRNKIDQQTTQKKTAPVSAWRYPTRFRTLGFSENPHRAPGCLCPVLQVSTTGKSWLRCTGRRNSLPNCGSIKAIHKDGNRSFYNIKKKCHFGQVCLPCKMGLCFHAGAWNMGAAFGNELSCWIPRFQSVDLGGNHSRESHRFSI